MPDKDMHRQLINIFTILLLSFVTIGCDSFSWQRYDNKEYGFSILLPRGWQKKEMLDRNTIIMALDRLKGPKDKVQENISVVVSPLPKEASLPTYFVLNKEEIMQNLPGYKENISESELFAGTNPGKVLAFDNRLEEGTLRVISACWKKGERVYVVTCVSQLEEYPRYKILFRKVMRSLRIY